MTTPAPIEQGWSEEALQRSLQDHPWKRVPQLWIALLGGIVASAAIAYVNGERLGLSETRRRSILVLSGAFFLGALVLTLGRIHAVPLTTWQEQLRASRAIELGLAVVFWGLAALVQGRPRASGGTPPPVGSLWAPGLSAVALLGLPGRLLFSILVLLLA